MLLIEEADTKGDSDLLLTISELAMLSSTPGTEDTTGGELELIEPANVEVGSTGSELPIDRVTGRIVESTEVVGGGGV